MARQDKSNNFAVTPTVNGSPVWTENSLTVGGTNLIARCKATPGYIISSDTIVTATPGQNEKSTDFIPVVPGDTYQLSYSALTAVGGQGNYRIVTYEVGQKFIALIHRFSGGTVTTQTTVEDKTSFVVPDGVSYVRVSWRDNLETKIKLEKGTIATDWSPAPEDIQSQIDAINAQLDSLKA